MATNLPTFTIDYVKEICPEISELGISDKEITAIINRIDKEFGKCLEGSYGDEFGSLLAAKATCYQLMVGRGGTLPISSETDANGSNVTYETTRIQQDSRNYVDQFDTQGCLANLIAPKILIQTINGGSTPNNGGYY